MTFPRLPWDDYLALCRKVMKRDGYRCQYCGSRNNLECHHIIARSQGGPDTEENMVTLCRTHHEQAERGEIVWEDE